MYEIYVRGVKFTYRNTNKSPLLIATMIDPWHFSEYCIKEIYIKLNEWLERGYIPNIESILLGTIKYRHYTLYINNRRGYWQFTTEEISRKILPFISNCFRENIFLIID